MVRCKASGHNPRVDEITQRLENSTTPYNVASGLRNELREHEEQERCVVATQTFADNTYVLRQEGEKGSSSASAAPAAKKRVSSTVSCFI